MVIKIRKGTGEYKELVSYGSWNDSSLDKLCALLIAVSPLLQHYKGLYENAGFTALFFAFPILSLRFLTRSGRGYNAKTLSAIFPLILFELYTAVDHTISVSRLLYVVFMIWVFLCIACGCVNTVFFLKYAVNVVSLAVVLLFVQYISHYIFHHTLNLRPFNLLVSQDVIWVRHLNSSSAGRLYRPAAFFLEPSHLFLYSFPLLCILLLSPGMTKWRRNKAIIITTAMVMSTSGFSIVACIGLWSLYFLIYKKGAADKHIDYRKIFSGRNVLIVIIIICVLSLAYFYIPLFRRSVNRIFTDTEGTNAISGRVRLALNYITGISGRAVLFGAANVSGTLEFNLAGFFATYIRWGIIGVALTYWFYGQGLFLLKKKYFWMSAIIIVISFFTAHTHGTFYMMYYVVFLMNGYYEKSLKYRHIPSGGAIRI